MQGPIEIKLEQLAKLTKYRGAAQEEMTGTLFRGSNKVPRRTYFGFPPGVGDHLGLVGSRAHIPISPTSRCVDTRRISGAGWLSG